MIDKTTRGYTGHEHLDETGIIHMNGRIYSAYLGRFLQADPIIQDPFDAQSLNRYSYVINNPHSFNDPSGYSSVAAFMNNIGRPLIGVAITVYAPNFGLNVLTSQAFAGAVKNGTRGAATAVVSAFTGVAFNGVISSIVTSGADNLLLKNINNFTSRVFVNAIVAGTISEVTGGKFGNAALTVAFRTALKEVSNEEYVTGNAPSSGSLVSLNSTEEQEFIQTVEDEIFNTFIQEGVKMREALNAGDQELAGAYMQARQVLGRTVVFDLQNSGPNNAMMQVSATFNKSGQLTNSVLTIYNGAYATFLNGNIPPHPYVTIDSGVVGLRFLLAHESGHGIISRTLDQNFRALPINMKERLADKWAKKVWE